MPIAQPSRYVPGRLLQEGTSVVRCRISDLEAPNGTKEWRCALGAEWMLESVRRQVRIMVLFLLAGLQHTVVQIRFGIEENSISGR